MRSSAARSPRSAQPARRRGLVRLICLNRWAYGLHSPAPFVLSAGRCPARAVARLADREIFTAQGRLSRLLSQGPTARRTSQSRQPFGPLRQSLRAARSLRLGGLGASQAKAGHGRHTTRRRSLSESGILAGNARSLSMHGVCRSMSAIDMPAPAPIRPGDGLPVRPGGALSLSMAYLLWKVLHPRPCPRLRRSGPPPAPAYAGPRRPAQSGPSTRPTSVGPPDCSDCRIFAKRYA